MMANSKRVMTAQPYESIKTNSGRAAPDMLLRQFQFPDTYDKPDKLLSIDHDVLMERDFSYTMRCFDTHIALGNLRLGDWIDRAFDDQIIEFMKHALRAELLVTWTGFRILGSIRRDCVFPVFTFELFAKHRTSNTRVYTGKHAPNIAHEAMQHISL